MTAVQGVAPAYIEQRLVVQVNGVRYPAVLTTPSGHDNRMVVVVVPGSLAIDADGNMPTIGIRPHAYADLARQLATRGTTVLRYAKGGPGTGTEVVDSAAAVAQRHFRGRVDAARAALDSLLSHVGGQHVVVLAGHSEGAVVAGLLAKEDDRVNGVVSLSGPAVGLFSIMRAQLSASTTDREGLATFDAAVALLRAYQGLPADAAKHRTTAMLAQMDATSLTYITEVDAVDPARLYASLSLPVLLVQGESDPSVLPENARQLAAARAGLPTELVMLPGLQHFYKSVSPGADPMASFGLETESDPAVAEAIVRWMTTNLSNRRPCASHWYALDL